MRITGNWIGHHGAWPVAPARETKTPALATDASTARTDWRDRLPFWTGFAVLAVAIAGLDLLIVWAAISR